MFKKNKRITTARFDEIMKTSRVVRADILYARFAQAILGTSRFAIVIPKKIIKGSVKRHLIKRKISHILKSFENKFPAHDYIFFLGKYDETFSKEKIEEDILKIISLIK